ncbi:MAG: glycosyltransferase family 4 protein [Paludibacter sp.]|jgi:teichuronic acid biosynthesis glycosyltransferase TuaC
MKNRKILVVCSENSGRIAPFIEEQVNALKKIGLQMEIFGVKGKGIRGYLKNWKLLLQHINEFQPDIIHAHYGLSGLLANLQRKVPVVTTYHGSDINDKRIFRISKLTIRLSEHNIFVSQKNVDKAKLKKKFSLISCGVDTSVFYPQNQEACRREMKLSKEKKYILFAGAFDNQVKNASLALNVVSTLKNTELIELKDYTRENVACLMNAVNACLMTSHSEGSPQFIKEAMACNCPVVSVDVGDVKELLEGVKHCYLAKYDIQDISEKLNLLFENGERTNGKEKISNMHLDSTSVARRILEVYNSI